MPAVLRIGSDTRLDPRGETADVVDGFRVLCCAAGVAGDDARVEPGRPRPLVVHPPLDRERARAVTSLLERERHSVEGLPCGARERPVPREARIDHDHLVADALCGDAARTPTAARADEHRCRQEGGEERRPSHGVGAADAVTAAHHGRGRARTERARCRRRGRGSRSPRGESGSFSLRKSRTIVARSSASSRLCAARGTPRRRPHNRRSRSVPARARTWS